MSDKFNLFLRIGLIVLMAISAVFILLFYFGNAIGEGPTYEPLITENMLFWTYTLFFIAVAVALGFPIAYIIKHPETAKKTLISLGVIAGVVFLGFLMADDTVLNIQGYDGADNVPATLKWVGTLINTTYILLFGAIGLTIAFGVSKLFKK